MNIVSRIIKSFIYCVVFAFLFGVMDQWMGLPTYLCTAILLGLIAAIANEHRKYPSVWDDEDVYVVVCACFDKNDMQSIPSLSYQFAKTRDEAIAIIKSDVEEHIKNLHKPVGCASDYCYIDMDDGYNRWSWRLMKKNIHCSRTQEF